LLLLPAFSFSQDITGVWKGEFYVDSTKQYYPFELTISEDKGKLTGYSRISFEEKGIKHVVFRDHKIRMQADSIIIEDDNQLTKASSVSQPREVKKIMVVGLTKLDSTMRLSGRWSTNKTRHYLAASGSVAIQKKNDFKETAIFKKLDSLSLAKKLSFNKPPVAEPEPVEETAKLDKVILDNIAKLQIAKRIPAARTAVTKPSFSIKHTEPPIAKTEKPVIPEEKPVAVIPQPEKKATPPVVKPQPVVKQPAAPIVKNDKPVIPKPAIVKTEQPVTKPAEKRNVVLPEQKNVAVDVSKRTVNSMQEFFFSSDSLQLTLYDNGEIDGDTVSVLLNGKVIIAKKGLDTKPNSYTIYFDKAVADSQMLVMYAENLGTIPPNTGLLVIREGRSVQEVRFSADLKTNAAIILRRKKDD